jgi:hypothetical protein
MYDPAEIKAHKALEARKAALDAQRVRFAKDGFDTITLDGKPLSFDYLDEEGRECTVELSGVVGLHSVYVMPVPKGGGGPDFCLVLQDDNALVSDIIRYEDAFESLRIPSVEFRFGPPDTEVTIILPYAEDRYVARALSTVPANTTECSIVRLQTLAHEKAQAELEKIAGHPFLDRAVNTQKRTTIGALSAEHFKPHNRNPNGIQKDLSRALGLKKQESSLRRPWNNNPGCCE